MRDRILIIGDIWLEVDITVSPGGRYGTGTADGYAEGIGGFGGSAALCAGRLGYPCVLAGKIGSDATGERIRTYLLHSKADVRYVLPSRTEKTAVMTRIFDGEAHRDILYAGASEDFCGRDAEKAFLCEPQALYISTSSPEEVLRASVRHSAERGIPSFVVVSEGKIPDPSAFYGADTVILTDDRVRTFTGVSCASIEGCMKATLEINRMTGAKNVIIKRGTKGIYLSYGKYYQTVQAYSLRARSTDYADPAFDMAYIGYYLRTGLREQACEYANIVGSITASRAGKLISVPSTDEIEKFGRANCPRLYGGDNLE